MLLYYCSINFVKFSFFEGLLEDVYFGEIVPFGVILDATGEKITVNDFLFEIFLKKGDKFWYFEQFLIVLEVNAMISSDFDNDWL